MPCVIKLKEFLTDQVYEKSKPALSMSYQNAVRLTDTINKGYGYNVVYPTLGDTVELEITIPEALITDYYNNELKLEIQEAIEVAQKAEEEAREIQRRDAERAGIPYQDDYLFQNENDIERIVEKTFREARDQEIATKLGEKYKKAFGIEYQIVSPSEAALILQLSPTPYTSDVSAFFYGNQVYFVRGNFNSKNVIHEFSHPLIKGIAFQNPKLFNNLYAQLSGSVTGQEAIERVKSKYPELEVDSERFKEEAIVTAMEIDAELKLEKIKSNDSLFDKFIETLIFAIKKVIQALTKKVNLKNLSTSTTRDQLVDMMINEDFVIQDLNFQTSLFAEFNKETDAYLKELKSVAPEKILNTINRFHTEMSFQLQELRTNPKKLRERLGKDAEQTIRGIRDYVNGYKTTGENISDDELQTLIDSLINDEADLNARSLAFIKSLTELNVFARRVQRVLEDMNTSKEYLTEEGNQKIQYFKQFMEREIKFLTDVYYEIGLDSSNKLSQEILGIKQLMQDNSKIATDMTFKYVKEFLLNAGLNMQENVKEETSKEIDKILKTDGFTEAEINDFKQDLFDRLDVDKIRNISAKDFKLPRESPRAKYILQEIEKYNKNKITEQVVDEYLRGHVQDLGFGGAMLTPLGNVNDLFGGFIQYARNKISDAEVKSQQEQMKFVESLKPILNAMNWNPNNTQQLGNALLFVDKKGIINEDGDVEEYEAYAYLDKFKNWELDEANLKGALKKAQIEAQLKGDKEAIKVAMQAMRDFERDYKVRRYTDEVYKLQDIWLQSNTVMDPTTKKTVTISANVSLEAYQERKAALDDLNTYSDSNEFTSLDDLLEFTPSAASKVKYNNLYNLYDNNGNYKQGIELEKVLVRRYYRQQSRQFYESVPVLDKLQRDYEHFVNTELASLGITKDATPEKYDAEIKKFFEKNTRIAYTDEYFQDKNDVLAEINAINEKAKGAEISKKLASLYEQRYTITNRVTDKDGEPNGTELGIDSIKKLKAIEEEIVVLSESFDKKTGLSKTEAYKLRYYEEKIIGAGKASQMTQEQKNEYQSLVANRTAFGLSEQEITYLRGLFKKLAELTDNVATDYYVDSFNTALGELELEPITIDTADDWINSQNTLQAKADSPRFSEWFDRNHYEKTVFNPELGVYESRFFRTKAWTVSKPSNPKYFKKTELIDPITGEKITIDGVPIAKYSYTKIKDKYKTGFNAKTGKIELEVGTHIDNRGNFLPKEQAIGSTFGKYMNERYYEMKKANSPEFKLLEAIKKQRLKNQEDSPYTSRMYLDFPRFRINTNIEYGQSGALSKDIKDKTSALRDALNASIFKAADDAESGQANFDPNFIYVPTDLQGKPLPKVPVSGLYKMPINSVSLDVITSELNYMRSLDIQKVLINSQSSASAVLDVLGDPDNALDRLDRASSKLSNAQNKMTVFLKRDTNTRLQFAKDTINRMWFGENVSEYQQENPVLSKIVRGAMGAASVAFYAGNPISTIKNKAGMTFQKLIKTAGGKHINLPAIARAEPRVWKVTTEYVTSGTYTTGLKSLDMQLMDAFDMSPGKTKKDATRTHTNTAIKNLADGAWMYSDRKITEVKGALELGFGLMEWQEVDQVQPDGSVTKIKYADAFIIGEDGIAKVKDGINLEWGMNYTDHTVVTGDTLASIAKKYHMTVEELAKKNKIETDAKLEDGKELIISRNTKFNMMKLRMASANKKLNGTVASIEGPIAEKHLLYDVASFSRKFGTGMFLSRFQMDTSKGFFKTIKNGGGDVWDWDLNETTKGKYITFLQWTYKMITDYKNYWPIMKEEERIAVRETIMEGMLIGLSSLAIIFIFGYDNDDEDRFQKLKDREAKYGRAGWVYNHMLYQVIMVQKENSSLIPLPGLGLSEWSSFSKTSTIVMGPTFDLYQKIIKDLYYIMTGDDTAIYKQDVGPYGWQQEGEYKIWNHLGSILGLSGKNLSPYWAIKKQEIFTNLKG